MGSDPAIRKWYCDFDIYRPCSYIRSSVDTLEYIYILYLSKSIHTCVFEQVAHLKAILVTNGLTLLVLTTVPHTAIHFPVINKYYILTTITNYSVRSIYYNWDLYHLKYNKQIWIMLEASSYKLLCYYIQQTPVNIL